MNDNQEYLKPFRVIILEDCRETYGSTGCLTGQLGVCLGLYTVPDNFSVPKNLNNRVLDYGAESILEKLANKSIDTDYKEIELVNRLIISHSGDYIWGIQCYFATSEDLVDIPTSFWLQIPESYRELLKREIKDGEGRN